MTATIAFRRPGVICELSAKVHDFLSIHHHQAISLGYLCAEFLILPNIFCK
jgi:hypothetical protein